MGGEKQSLRMCVRERQREGKKKGEKGILQD